MLGLSNKAIKRPSISFFPRFLGRDSISMVFTSLFMAADVTLSETEMLHHGHSVEMRITPT